MRHLLILVLALTTTGCADIATRRMADNLSSAIVNHDDPATVRDGAPAFLLLVDSLIEGAPDSTDTLAAGSRLYSAYAGAFVIDAERRRRLTETALHYAERALCLEQTGICRAKSYPEFARFVQAVGPDDTGLLYDYGAALAGWIQARQTDWTALAELPKVEAVMQRVLALDEGHDHGRAHLYLGVIDSRLPAALGGRPEEGRRHFERAMQLSGGRDLTVALEYARTYARTVFDRPLHDRLLKEVMAADPYAPGLTLANVLARQRAGELLAESADYFGE